MNAISKILFIGMVSSIFFMSCRKEECSKAVPDLAYNRFIPEPLDTGQRVYNLVFDFTDCDGDFGKGANSEIVDENGVRQTVNFFIDMYYVENGQWKKYEFGPDAPGFNTNIPVLSDNSASSILTGEIEKSITLAIYPFDTIQFEAKILDNAGHYSDTVRTPAFVMN